MGKCMLDLLSNAVGPDVTIGLLVELSCQGPVGEEELDHIMDSSLDVLTEEGLWSEDSTWSSLVFPTTEH